jgi:DNA-binding protein HU-beta
LHPFPFWEGTSHESLAKPRFSAPLRLTGLAFGRCFGLAAVLSSLKLAGRRIRPARGHVFPSTRTTNMSKKDLIDAVAAATELPKEKATVAVDAVIAHIEASMKKGEEVRIPGFGTFKVAKRAARKARNPQTGVEMMLKASIVPKFSASKNLKEALN